MEHIVLLKSSTEILSLVKQTRDSAAAVAEGDVTAFQTSMTLDSLAIYRDFIRDLTNDQQQAAQLEEIAAREEDRQLLVAEVDALIERQDAEIADLFKEAAEAAEFNKTLAYIDLAAKLYHGWTKLDAYLSEGEREATQEAASETRDGLIASQTREPASAAALEPAVKLVNNLLGLAAEYGDLAQARRAQERFDAAFVEAANSIPLGAEQSFDVYVSKSDPFLFRFLNPTGEPSLSGSGATYLNTVTIKGSDRGTRDRIDMHIQVIAD